MSWGFNTTTPLYNRPRRTVYGRKGMVCTSQTLAAHIGLDMLKKGGNAVDAAVAVAISLTVLEPVSNGIGSDLFAIIHMDGHLYGLNGSGFSPAKLMQSDPAIPSRLPSYGWLPVMIPGAPAAWYELHSRFGKLPFESLFEPAVDYAENGFAVMSVLARLLQSEYKKYAPYKNRPEFSGLFNTFFSDGPTEEGCVLTLPDHGKTLRNLAETACSSLYTGQLSRIIDEYSRMTGGLIRHEDLSAYKPSWTTPVKMSYKDYDVWELPPNGQGIVVSAALDILNNLTPSTADPVEKLHMQIEALKASLTDGKKTIADPTYMKISTDDFLSEESRLNRQRRISATAHLPDCADVSDGGTVYACTADKDGNSVSLIQSNYDGFGSGIVIPGTGIALNNRGRNFSADPTSPNAVGPRKKSYHTIIPSFLSKDGIPIGPFGIMGAFMQPQGQLQLVIDTVDEHLDPQSALNKPRWQWTGDKNIEVEPDFDPRLVAALREKGHCVTVNSDIAVFGRGQIIWRNKDGILAGATDPRTDGDVAVW